MLGFWFAIVTWLLVISSVWAVAQVPSMILLAVHGVLLLGWLFVERQRWPLWLTYIGVVSFGLFFGNYREFISFPFYTDLGMISLWMIPAMVSALIASGILFNRLADWLQDPFKQLKPSELPQREKKLVALRKQSLIYNVLLVGVLVLVAGFLKQFTVPMLALALVVLCLRWLVINWRERMFLVLTLVGTYLLTLLAVKTGALGFNFVDFGLVPIWFTMIGAVAWESMISQRHYW